MIPQLNRLLRDKWNEITSSNMQGLLTLLEDLAIFRAEIVISPMNDMTYSRGSETTAQRAEDQPRYT
jgi:hypothetical protein